MHVTKTLAAAAMAICAVASAVRAEDTLRVGNSSATAFPFVLPTNEALTARVYDETMPMFSATGHFDPKVLAVLSKSYVDMGLLPAEPDMRKLYTEKFLPNGQM